MDLIHCYMRFSLGRELLQDTSTLVDQEMFVVGV